MTKIYDLAIIGGGVNGCGIARDAIVQTFGRAQRNRLYVRLIPIYSC